MYQPWQLQLVMQTGCALDLLIIFAGKNFQGQWKGDKAIKNTTYDLSDSEWMTTDIFSTGFC